MKNNIDRRSFLKTTGLLTASVGLAGFHSNVFACGFPASVTPNADKLGWRLGVHGYSFRKFTLYESIEKTASIGLQYIGAYPTQRLSPKKPEVRISEELPKRDRRDIRKWLDDSGLKMLHLGVWGFDQGEDKFRPVYDLAAELGVETILAEPPEDSFDALDKLCNEYNIALAIHNHPRSHKGSRYWSPELVLKARNRYDDSVGACADTGHWARTGWNTVNCLEKLQGHILALHLKDMSQLGDDGHCVPFGTGVCDVKGMLSEIHKQQIKPVFMIEYESNWDNNISDIRQCVNYFDSVAGMLLSRLGDH